MNQSQLAIANQANLANTTDGYLKFMLNRHTPAVMSMRHTQEAIVIPVESVTAMPGMPACILGLMNWRSRIIWAIDLPQLLNIESLETRLRQYSVVIVRVDTLVLGLVVDDIIGTTKFLVEEIHSPIGQVASSLVPYLRGYINHEDETLLALDAHAIVHSSVLRQN